MNPPQFSSPQSNSHTVFSVTEILVVISIGTLLAAFLLAGMKGVQDRAKKIGDLNNLKQIGTYIMLYAQDHDGILPPANASGWQPLQMALAPYLGDPAYVSDLSVGRGKSVFVSPLAKLPNTVAWYRLNYTAHQTLMGNPPYRMLQIHHPSTVILVANGAQNAASGGNCTATFWNPAAMKPDYSASYNLEAKIPTGPNDDTAASAGYFRYLADQNTATDAVLADGHVESFKIGTIRYKNVIFDH